MPFRLDGCIDLDITIGDHGMRTPAYVKMDAKEPLLLSEGVCRQLQAVEYHPSVTVTSAPHGKCPSANTTPPIPATVKLVRPVRVPPCSSVVASVQVDGVKGDVLLEPVEEWSERIEESLVHLEEDTGMSQVVVSNPSQVTQCLEQGVQVCEAVPVMLSVVQRMLRLKIEPPKVYGLVSSERVQWQKQTLLHTLIHEKVAVLAEDETKLCELLSEYHDVFSLEEGERGQTDLIEFSIDTGDARPIRHPLRRTPFAAKQEIACQLHKMQSAGVIQPNNSPWASPVVLVKKRDNTYRFCVDYRSLNALTKSDAFPLPRMDDLLDQLGQLKCFSTLDLAAGYWQIPVDERSKEKTAFATQDGLFEFPVMPFGLTNAPATFQRLMQQFLSGLKSRDGADYVSVYVDDVLIFSRSVEEHIQHLRAVLECMRAAKLKLKPTKCKLLREEVEYLGHVITPNGLKPTTRHLDAV